MCHDQGCKVSIKRSIGFLFRRFLSTFYFKKRVKSDYSCNSSSDKKKDFLMAMQCRVKDRDAARVPSLSSRVGLGRAWRPEYLLLIRCSESYDRLFFNFKKSGFLLYFSESSIPGHEQVRGLLVSLLLTRCHKRADCPMQLSHRFVLAVICWQREKRAETWNMESPL